MTEYLVNSFCLKLVKDKTFTPLTLGPYNSPTRFQCVM